MLNEKVTLKDRERFLQEMTEIHGDEFAAPTVDELVDPAPKAGPGSQSIFAVYREALGAPVELRLSTGQNVILTPPKVKTLKYMLAKAAHLQELAEKDPNAVLTEFEKIMLQCIEFPAGDTPADIQDWFDNLPGDDGLQFPERFNEVFNLNKILGRTNALGKK